MAITIIRPNQEFTVKANVSRGDTRLVSWIIFQGHSSNEANILNIYPKKGLELNHLFQNEGKFRLAAYNKEIHTKDDFQGSSELKHVDVEVKFNQLEGTKLMPKNAGDFLAGDIFRKDFPAVFEAKFLINPISQEEISRLHFMLEDGSGNTLNEGTQALNVFTFTPRNSNAKYIIKASYTNESGAVSSQTFMGTSKALSIKDITHNKQVVRPGTPMSFSVAKTQFGGVSNDSHLPEQGNIKWNLDKVFIGSGRTINISGHQLMQKKKYHIEAYVTSAIGKTTGDNEDGVENDWHFEVKENIVETIKVVKKPKYGIEGEFEIEKMTFPNHDPAKDGTITWIVTGPEQAKSSDIKFKKIFSTPGKYTISCNIGGRECREPLTLEILQPEVIIDRCKWIDEDHKSGNIITEAGINQRVCAFVHGNGLDNENLTLTVYDDDSAGRTDVYSYTFTTDESHKTGFYLPFTITQDVIDKIKKEGFSDYGDLYFNVVRNGSELPVKNGDKKLGEYLKVTLEPKIVDAYFCDANDTQKLFSSSLDGALYFKIYAINLVGRKVEITYITESDAYWTWDDEMKIKDWESIKSKFEDEKPKDTKTGTFNEKGEVLVPVDLSKMGKPKNFIRLNAMVKILPDENVEEKQEEKGFYMQHTNLAILFPGATLPTMVKNKGAVKVGRARIDGGENCGGKFCIKKGSPNSELIREINIRLAGFGGNVPTDEFTDRTEKMIKQFQKDYMKVPETGKVCGNVLIAIDEFSNNYKFTFSEVKCKCGTKGRTTKDILLNRNVINNCSGFGDGDNKGKYVKNGNTEKHHAYEYPGIHRSLLFSLKSIMFYMDKVNPKYKYNSISSGFRCRFHDIFLNSQTTNHMGKALDVLFNYEKGNRAQKREDLDAIRKDYFEKYLDATYWTAKNKFGLETYAQGAKTWVHVDVREFDSEYLKDEYFCKDESKLIGKSILALAAELGFTNTCQCLGSYQSQSSNNSSSNTCEDKFKKVAPIILKHEGGYVNDPNDSGGITNKGITIGIWKQYAKEDLNVEPTVDNLKKITDDQATLIYRKRYWEPKKFCEINDDKVSLMIYDWTITSGGAVKEVQKLLKNEFQQDIEADGGMGNLTVKAINNVEDQTKLFNRIGEIRKQYYTDLAYKDDGSPSKNFKFLKGWHNRVDDCLNYKP